MFLKRNKNLRSLKVYNFFSSHADLKSTHSILASSYSSHLFLPNSAYLAVKIFVREKKRRKEKKKASYNFLT